MTTIAIAAPIRPAASSGNDITAARWAGHLTDLGHHVTILAVDEAADEPEEAGVALLNAADVLLVLHARRSAAVAGWWRAHRGARPLIVALTGTDLYHDMPDDRAAMATVEAADAVLVLQPAAVRRLGEQRSEWVDKTWVVHQSVDPATVPQRRPSDDEFRVVVLAHLRKVKDPLLAARAARLLSPSSRVTIHHAGRAHDRQLADAATAEAANNPRYIWHGELDRQAALALLATGTVLACTSLAEGGANVVTEAIAVGVPVIGTRIDGNTGLLGDDHPGLVPVGDHQELAGLLDRLENDPDALVELQRRANHLLPLTDPGAERATLAEILAELRPISEANAG